MAAPITRDVDPLAGLRFSVEVQGLDVGYFNECSGVSAEVKVDSYEEGGANHYTRKIPGRANFGNVTLKRGMTDDDTFVKWFLDVSIGKKSRKTITIHAWTNDGKKLQSFTLHNAFPAKFAVPALQTTANAVIIESLEFAHEGVTS